MLPPRHTGWSDPLFCLPDPALPFPRWPYSLPVLLSSVLFLKKYFYKPLIDSGFRPDVIDEEADLEKYDIVLSPLMLTLDQGELRVRIEKWVKNGGIWVTGPMTDIRTKDGTRFTDRLHGMLEDLTPAVFKYWFPDKEKSIKAKWNDGEDFGGNTYYEIFEPNENAGMVTVTGGHNEIIGGSVMQCFPVGNIQYRSLLNLLVPQLAAGCHTQAHIHCQRFCVLRLFRYQK